MSSNPMRQMRSRSDLILGVDVIDNAPNKRAAAAVNLTGLHARLAESNREHGPTDLRESAEIAVAEQFDGPVLASLALITDESHLTHEAITEIFEVMVEVVSGNVKTPNEHMGVTTRASSPAIDEVAEPFESGMGRRQL